ncbi:MAG TPA: protein translocase subunit SecF [Acidimicrobiales bacterium]|nr:protein translocase subunit SecF [Acidimicrobiales bacterium]
MSASPRAAFGRLFRGETSFDFAGKWRTWFAVSGVIILAGVVSMGFRGLNFSIDFKGGTVWEVPSTASVSHARSVVDSAVPGFGQATIQVLTNTQTHQRTVKVAAPAKLTGQSAKISAVSDALAKMANVSTNDVTVQAIGPSWGSDISHKAIVAVIVFLVVVSGYIWLRFEGKMAIAALVALVHDILITAGIYSLSGFEVSPDTVIAFLTILGYSLYDTIVVFDRIQENTRGLASTNRITYTDTVNLSMNQVLARSLNTSLVAILPITSILVIGAWVLGATGLQTFGLALFVGLTSGAYSSIFIASPLLALLKEREPRYSEIRRRLQATVASGGGAPRRLTPAAAASGAMGSAVAQPVRVGADARGGVSQPLSAVDRLADTAGAEAAAEAAGGSGSDAEFDSVSDDLGVAAAPPAAAGTPSGPPSTGTAVPPRSGNRPPPRPRKKGRRR